MENHLKKILLWGVYALPLIVFISFGLLSFPAISEKSFVFRILVEMLFGLWLIMALRNPIYRPKLSWVLLALLDFLIVIGIANFLGADPVKSIWSNLERMDGYISLLHFFAYFIILVSVLQTTKQWKTFFHISITASVIVAVVGLFQTDGGRIVSLLGNSAYLAAYLLMHIFITAYYLLQRSPGTWVLFGYVSSLLLLTSALIATGTRGALLGLVAGAGFAAVVMALFEKELQSYRKWAVGFLLSLSILVAGLFFFVDSEFVQNNAYLERATSISLSENTATARLLVWDIALDGAQDRLLLGWGQGNFEIVFNTYYNPELAGAEVWFDKTHNIVIEWMISGGFFGILFFSVLLLFAFFQIAKCTSLSVTARALLMAALIGYLVQGMFESDTLWSYLYLFTLLAFIHSLVGQHWKDFFTSRGVTFSSESKTHSTGGTVVPILIIALTILVAISLNYKPIQSNALFMKGHNLFALDAEEAYTYFDQALSYDTFGLPEIREQFLFNAATVLFSESVNQETKNLYKSRAYKEIDLQIAARPGYARYPVHAAFLSAREGDIERAVQYWATAKEIAPKKEKIFIDEGVALYNYGHYEQSVESFKMAYALAPDRSEIKEKYVNATHKISTNREFQELVENEYGTTTPPQEFLIPIYQERNNLTAIVQIYTNLIADNPNDLQLYISKAATFVELGDIQSAREILEQVKQKKPEATAEIDSYISTFEQ